jgi:hypothetical protein
MHVVGEAGLGEALEDTRIRVAGAWSGSESLRNLEGWVNHGCLRICISFVMEEGGTGPGAGWIRLEVRA